MRIYYFGELIADTETLTIDPTVKSSSVVSVGDVLKDRPDYKRLIREPKVNLIDDVRSRCLQINQYSHA
jgi:hypothetical protein